MKEDFVQRFWVDHKFGDDYNPGTFEHPYKTIRAAKQRCGPRDLIVIVESRYPEDLVEGLECSYDRQKGKKKRAKGKS